MELRDFFPMWDKLEPSQRQTLENSLGRRSVKKDEIIYSGDMECTGLYLVVSGQLRAYILSEEGREISIYRLFPRDICLFSASCIMHSIQFQVTIQAEKEEDTLQIMAKKLEEINTCLAERSARTRRRIRTIAIVMILLAFAGIVLLLLFSTGLLHQPPSGPNIIGGADGATGILIVGTNRFAFGVGMAVCICALIAGGILLHRSKR